MADENSNDLKEEKNEKESEGKEEEEGDDDNEEKENEEENDDKENENEEEEEEEENNEEEKDEEDGNKNGNKEGTEAESNKNKSKTVDNNNNKLQEGELTFSLENKANNSKSLLSILEEISINMDNLAFTFHNQFFHQRPTTNNQSTISDPIPEYKPKPVFINEKDEISHLLSQAEQLSKAIESELLKDNYLIESQQNDKNNSIGSMKKDLNQSSNKIISSQTQQYNYESVDNKTYFPYDPNKYKDYYESLNVNRINKSMDDKLHSYKTKESNTKALLTFNNNPPTEKVNQSQVIRNDNIYLNNSGQMNSLPIIYSQHSNEIGSSIGSNYSISNSNPNDEFMRNKSNLLSYNNPKEYYLNQSRQNYKSERINNPFEQSNLI